MLDNDCRKILHILMQTKGSMTSEEISFHLSKSSKTVLRRIKDLENELKNEGASIVSKKGIGFHLEISNSQVFNAYYRNVDTNTSLEYTLDNNQLCGDLIYILFTHNRYIKADELMDILYISKSKLTQLLNDLRTIIKQYDLELLIKPYHGLKIVGSEFDLRRFISSYYAQYNTGHHDRLVFSRMARTNSMDIHKYEIICQIIKEQLVLYKYPMPLNIVTSLQIHLYILVTRIAKGMILEDTITYLNQQRTNDEEPLARGIIQCLEKEFTITFPKSEYEYLMIHLISKKVMDISESKNIPTEVNKLVEEILVLIKEKANIDLVSDLDLRIMLGLHLVPLLTRLQYHIEMKNPILEDIQCRCIVGYDLAILSSQVINSYCHATLSEHEISYLALHFDVALNRGNREIRKKRILVVCSSGRASAQLLKFKFEDLFKQYIEKVVVCDVNEATIILQKESFDCIFTTIPWKLDTLTPIFEFQFFLNNESVNMIRSVLNENISNQQIIQYFRPSMFFGIHDFHTKEEVLNYMFKQIHLVEDIPKDFEQLVLQRESISGTDILPRVALPHPNQVITKDTFIAVLILQKPILWKTHKIQMVLLISISCKESEKYKFLFEWIMDLLSNNQSIKHIIDTGTYESLQTELLQLYIGKEN